MLPVGGFVAQVDWLRPMVGGHLALFLHSSRELGELSQWLCHNGNTINIVLGVVIVIVDWTPPMQTMVCKNKIQS